MNKIFVAGHLGMVGSAICRRLAREEDALLITRTRGELDLLDQASVQRFFESERPNQVYLAAAKVGGIVANNTLRAEFIYQNLQVQNNVIHAAYLTDVQRLLFLGSSCVYPRNAEQPIKEESLLSGSLESTNEPYAIAKIAGIKLCEAYRYQYGSDFRCVMPTNLYGEGDNFHPEHSHVVPALMRRLHAAKQAGSEHVEIWGSGAPLREFMHVDDMASACVYLMGLEHKHYEAGINGVPHINVGTGAECSIRELATLLADIIGFSGTLSFDSSKPDGTPRKLLNTSRLTNLGWSPSIQLIDGLNQTYQWFLQYRSSMRGL